MDRTSHIGSSNVNYIQNYTSGKALSTGSYAKSLTADGQAENAGEWVEMNRHYYDEIMNGISELSPEDQEEFMGWWSWANDQLGTSSSSFGDDFSGSSTDSGTAPASGPALPAGAIYGAQGNIVYDQMDASISHTATSMPIDVYGNNIEINSGSMMTTFTSEVTTDTRTQNPDGSYEQVLKITASDGTVYYVHDFDDANITIRTPVQDMVDGGTPSQANITWEEYSATAATDDVPTTEPSYTGGDVEQTDESHWVHTGKVGEPIQFNPNPAPAVAPEHHDIYGDATITLRADMSAVMGFNGDGDTRYIHVFDRDGKEIAVYTLHEGNKTALNANENQVFVRTTWSDESTQVKMTDYDAGNNSFWNSDFSLNGEQGSKVANGTSSSSKDDDIPQSVEDFAKAFSPDLSDDEIDDIMGNSSLLNEIKYGNEKPSQELLDFIVKHDDELAYHVKKGDETLAANRLASLLKGAGYSVGNENHDNAVIGVNSTDYTLSIHGGKISLDVEVSMENDTVGHGVTE